MLFHGFGGVENGAGVEREVVLFVAVAVAVAVLAAGARLKKRMGVGAGVLAFSGDGLENSAGPNPRGLSFEVGNGAKLKLKAGCFTCGSGAAKLNLDGVSDTGGVVSTSGGGVAKLNSGRS